MKKNRKEKLVKLSVDKKVMTEAELVRPLSFLGALHTIIHQAFRLAVEEGAVAEEEVAVRIKRSERNVRRSLDNNHSHLFRVMQLKSKICQTV